MVIRSARARNELERWQPANGMRRGGYELTEEVREALEPLRVAERAHLDLHTRRRLRAARDTEEGLTTERQSHAKTMSDQPASERADLVGVGVADEQDLERVGEHHPAVLPLVAARADELHIPASRRRHHSSTRSPSPSCDLSSPNGGLDWLADWGARLKRS